LAGQALALDDGRNLILAGLFKAFLDDRGPRRIVVNDNDAQNATPLCCSAI
jgi:hypothetical protein